MKEVVEQTKNKSYKSGKIRFFVLFLISMVIFGIQYAYNNPQALQTTLQEELDIDILEFQLFYSIYSFPTIFLSLGLGYLVDRIGVRICLITLTLSAAIFQVVITVGAYYKNYISILIGRMFLGIASECLIVAQATLVAYWFKGKQLGFALGISFSFPELSLGLNSYLTPALYAWTGILALPFLITAILCFASFFCALIACYYDRKAERLQAQEYLRLAEEGNQVQQPPEKIKLSDLKLLRWPFWLLCTLCMFCLTLWVVFLDNASELYQERFCYTQTSSGLVLAIIYVVAVVATVPMGYMSDKIGYRRYFMTLGMFLFTLAHLYMYLYPQCTDSEDLGSIGGLVLLAFSFGFYGNYVMASIPLLVPEKVLGSAFGIKQMLENTGFALCPLITGAIVEESSTVQLGYRNFSIFFIAVGGMGILLSFGFFLASDEVKGVLDRKAQEQEEYQERLKQNEYKEDIEKRVSVNRGNRGNNMEAEDSQDLSQNLLEKAIGSEDQKRGKDIID